MRKLVLIPLVCTTALYAFLANLAVFFVLSTLVWDDPSCNTGVCTSDIRFPPLPTFWDLMGLGGP